METQGSIVLYWATVPGNPTYLPAIDGQRRKSGKEKCIEVRMATYPRTCGDDYKVPISVSIIRRITRTAIRALPHFLRPLHTHDLKAEVRLASCIDGIAVQECLLH